jgi:hypothetical protein
MHDGIGEMLVVLVIAMLVFGPTKLPQLRAVAIPRSVRILIGSTLIDMRKSIDGPWPPCSRSSRARMGPS